MGRVSTELDTSSLKGKAVLVTGGAGFIGSHLVDRLLALGTRVTVYDNFDDFYRGKEENIRQHVKNKNFMLVEGNILDRERLGKAMTGVELVLHEAAQAGIRYCSEHPQKAHDVNATGTFGVLAVAKEAQIPRIVFSSSSSIFGLPKYTPIDEEHPTHPDSVYGASKLAAENYCAAFSKTYGMDIVALRYFSVYGPRGRPDQVIFKFTESLARGMSPTIYGDGNQTRDFTYVDDVVDATISATLSPHAGGETFNIGYGSETSINELFTILAEKMRKKSIKPRYKPGYGGEFPRTIAQNAKARKLLGWKPRISLREGIDKFLKWYEHKVSPK